MRRCRDMREYQELSNYMEIPTTIESPPIVIAPRWKATIGNYVNLIKPHVTVLLLGITAATMAIAEKGLPNLWLVLATLLGGAMAAGSANCLNCYLDRDIDQIMGRTQKRSLPSGRVE